MHLISIGSLRAQLCPQLAWAFTTMEFAGLQAERELGVPNEGPKQSLLMPEPVEFGRDGGPQHVQIRRREVGEPSVLDIHPDPVSRVEFGRVGWERLENNISQS